MGVRGRTLRMSRHRRCIRVGCIDQRVNLIAAQVLHEARCSAETARSCGDGLSQRRHGPPSQRQGDRHIGTGRELLAQQSRLRGAAKNEDVFFHVAR